MKKFSTFVCALFATTILFAAETTLWEATYTDGVEINSEAIASFQADDTLRIYLTVPEGGANFKICYKGAPDWTETTIPSMESQWPWVNGGEDHFDLLLTQADLDAIEGKNIYIYQGENSLITKVTLASTPDSDPDPEPGPEPVNPDTLQPGETRVLWEGSEILTWNEVAEQPASVGALLAENDQLIVTVSAKGTADWPKVLLRDASSVAVGDDILLNDISEFPYEAVFTLTAAHAAALQGGFKLCGDGVTVTKLVLKKYKEEEQPVEPAAEYEYRTVWTGDVAISWNQEVYVGTEFDTYTAQADMLAGLQNGDSIKIYYAQAIEGAQFALTYKAGTEWSWTDLAVTEGEGFFAYRVASEELAMDIADHGLVIRGQGYHLTSIVIGTPKSTTAIETISNDRLPVTTKFLRNGQLFILRDGVIYTVNGQIAK